MMHLGDVEDRFESAWGDTFPGLWRVFAGSRVSCVVCRRPGDSAGWGKGVGESHVTIEGNKPEETRVGSVSRGEDDILN